MQNSLIRGILRHNHIKLHFELYHIIMIAIQDTKEQLKNKSDRHSGISDNLKCI